RIENYRSSDGNPVILALAFDDGTVVSLTEQMNRAPVANGQVADALAIEDEDFLMTLPAGLFSDPDALDELRLNARLADGEPLPAWLSFDPTSGVLSGKPGNDDVGDLDVLVEATDHFGANASVALRITVQNTNDAPELAIVLADRQATEDAPFAFTTPEGAFRDVDAGDLLTLSATRADGSALPSWLSFDAATRTFSGTPTNDHVGSLAVRLTATDLAGAQASQTFTIEVANVNDAPEVGVLLGNQTGRVGQATTWQLPQGAFIDVDAGDVLSYSVTLGNGDPLPAWLAFDAATGTFSGAPTQAGSFALRVTATDLAGASSSQVFSLEVVGGGGNLPPVTMSDAASVVEDRKLLVWGNVLANDHDPEGGQLHVANPGIRQGEYGFLALLPGGGYAYALNNFSSKVQGLGAGETALDRFGYLASDGARETRGELAVTVLGANDAPELSRRLADVRLARGRSFAWRIPAGSFTDRDRNDQLTYTATLKNGQPLPAWLVFDAATQTFSGTAPAKANSAIDVKVVARDGHGPCSEASDVFRIRLGSTTIVPGASITGAGGGNGRLLSDSSLSVSAVSNEGGQLAATTGESARADDWLTRFLDGFKPAGTAVHALPPAMDGSWPDQGSAQQSWSDLSGMTDDAGSFPRRWAALSRALGRLDAERRGVPAWSDPARGAELSGLMPLHGASAPACRPDGLSLACGGAAQLKRFDGLVEGLDKLPW
ncbi:MAG TPA: putative Ig domain-containing protein, partial [Candidatus Omnitrophota bacterium]|nr:putative Ig domain-containing protein [Candidatus Omnitrophota bacterium]